jgi:hypothetical protein
VQRSLASMWAPAGWLAGLALVMAFVLPGGAARGSTVLRTDVDRMLADAALVFEGEVIAVRSERDAGGIHTWVRFAVHDVLKGQAGDTVELRFMGGTVDGVVREVVGSPIPALGEHGIYFVEATDRFLVNPLYGWHQGRLRVVPDARGRARVLSSGGAPVVAIGAPVAPRAGGIVGQVKAALAERLARLP